MENQSFDFSQASAEDPFAQEENVTVKELTKMAIDHDMSLAEAVSHLSESIVNIGKELAIMQAKELYRYIPDPNTDGSSRGCFQTWREYARYRLGKMSQSAMYEYLAAATLTKGSKPLAEKDVEELGIK